MSDLYNNTIEQLKRIKFALLVLTTVILIMSMLTGKNKIETAIDDLANLKRTFLNVTDNGQPSAIQSKIEEDARKAVLNTGHQFSTILARIVNDLDDSKQTHVIALDALFYPSPMNLKIPVGKTGLNGSSFNTGLYGAPSLDMLIYEWNRYHTIQEIYYAKEMLPYIVTFDVDAEDFKLSPIQAKQRKTKNQSRIRFSELMTVKELYDNEFSWILQGYPKEQNKFIDRLNELHLQASGNTNVAPFYLLTRKTFAGGGVFDGTPEAFASYFENLIIIPVITDRVTYRPLETVIQNVPAEFDWVNGSFELNFSALYELTQEYQEIPISNVNSNLAIELKRVSGTVQAFGLNIPFEILIRFGSLAILVIQIYFFFYLQYFHKQFSNGTELTQTVPWIYLHDNLKTLILFYMITILYPSVIVCYFSYKNLTTTVDIENSANIIIIAIELIVLSLLTHLIISHSKAIQPIVHKWRFRVTKGD